jgi:arylsulfate sulfotransferase
MKPFTLAVLFAAVSVVAHQTAASSVIINGQTAGPTAFIAQVQLTANPPTSVKSIKFQIAPKAGSVTRPVSATYPIEYLQKRGYFNSQSGAILLPVFGLYANFSNTVNLTYTFSDNSTQQASLMVGTPVFNTTCGYTTPTVVQPRTNSTTLSYDFMLVKNICGTASPVIIDTDGQVRWVGTAGVTGHSSTLFQNSVYLGAGPILYRMELDGTFVQLKDFSGNGVVDFHHNADFGKRGILLEVDTAQQTEAIDLEVDGLGNLLKTWDLAAIISAAMTAGGNNPALFVSSVHNPPVSTDDWFHNNSVTYKASDDSLLVSSRENFVIALDYASGAIRWVFGDTNKQWAGFTSLNNLKLNPGANTLPPIGQHALSITKDDNLLLFDNGRSSINHSPTGIDRSYSAPRKYQINTQTKTAIEVWNYEANQAFYSPFCSSVYEDAPLNYVVDYSVLGPATPQPPLLSEILGLDASGVKIFHYRYPTTNCDTAFNTMPVHFEQVVFNILPPPTAVSRKTHDQAGTFDIPLPLTGTLGVECRSGGSTRDYQVVTTFATPVTITAATVTPGNGATASVLGTPIVSGNQVTVNLTNVSHGQKLFVNLIGVSNGSTTENVSVPMGVLVGDTTNNQSVNSSDVSDVKAQSGMTVNASNFRRDITANGSVSSSDVSLAKSNSGTAITGQTKLSSLRKG